MIKLFTAGIKEDLIGEVSRRIRQVSIHTVGTVVAVDVYLHLHSYMDRCMESYISL